MFFNVQTGNLELKLLNLLGEMYGLGKSYLQKVARPGMYEVINYESTLEILDEGGKEAKFTKIEEVKFLQNNIIAFQDQAGGDGKILVNYLCSPGIPVDVYRTGHITHILISLRDVKQKGDQTEFRIQRNIRNGFLKSNGYWATDINHFTQKIKVTIILPEQKPPPKIILMESNRQRTEELSKDVITQLPDKRLQITWKKQNPVLNEHYILKWEW